MPNMGLHTVAIPYNKMKTALGGASIMVSATPCVSLYEAKALTPLRKGHPRLQHPAECPHQVAIFTSRIDGAIGHAPPRGRAAACAFFLAHTMGSAGADVGLCWYRVGREYAALTQDGAAPSAQDLSTCIKVSNAPVRHDPLSLLCNDSSWLLIKSEEKLIMQHTRVDGLSPGSPSYHNDVDDHASRIGVGRRARPALATTVLALAIALTLSPAAGMGVAHAKGGTAKPHQTPPPAAPVQVAVPPPPAVPPP